MESTRKQKIFDTAWIAAVLWMPWQTRLFIEGVDIAGWPWEQGRLSVYAVWIPMIAVVILGFGLKNNKSGKSYAGLLLLALLGLGTCTLLSGPEGSEAKLQWWLQISIAISFAITLAYKKISAKIASWYVISLLAPSLLGIWQFFTQKVFASTWLGLALHLPSIAGTSVVENNVGRILRVYGSFPHPNIFGGWLVAAIIIVLWLYANDGFIITRRWLLFILPIYSAVLVFTFSRSAWLGLMAGGVAMAVFMVIKSGFKQTARKIWLPGCLFLVTTAMAAGILEPYISSRGLGNGRLENQSLSERVISSRNGRRIFLARPWFGTGPNAELSVLEKIDNLKKSDKPLETPHNTWLLALDNFGLLGISFAIIILIFIRKRYKPMSWDPGLSVGVPVALIPISLLDHYLWSYWPGQVLAMMVLVFLMANRWDQNNQIQLAK